jgi:hypothetical protein
MRKNFTWKSFLLLPLLGILTFLTHCVALDAPVLFQYRNVLKSKLE